MRSRTDRHFFNGKVTFTTSVQLSIRYKILKLKNHRNLLKMKNNAPPTRGISNEVQEQNKKGGEVVINKAMTSWVSIFSKHFNSQEGLQDYKE